jgi:hypothetical protein
MKKLILTLSLGLFSLATFAQRVSLTANFSDFRIDNTSSGNTSIDYAGSTSMSANLRLYSKKHWAVRVGAGLDNLEYTVSDGIQTDYSARRQDLQGILGLEKHFIVANFLDIYPGVYVPLTITGDDILSDNYDNIQNGNLRAGLGLVAGANIKLLKILRLGLEFNASYDNFKTTVYESVDNRSLVPFQGLSYTTAFTLGVAF